MTEYVVFNADHFVMVEGVRFYEEGDKLEGEALEEAIDTLGEG